MSEIHPMLEDRGIDFIPFDSAAEYINQNGSESALVPQSAGSIGDADCGITEELEERGFFSSLDDLLQAEVVESEEIFLGVRRRQIAQLVSGTNIGKTTLALNLSLSLAAGETCLPLLPPSLATPRKVCYLDFEATASEFKDDLRTMLSNLSNDNEEIARRNLFPIVDASIGGDLLNLSLPAHFDRVRGWARLNEIDLLVVDNLSAAFSLLSENDNAEVKRRIIDPLKRMAVDCNCAVLIIHHKGRTSESDFKDGVYMGRGASNLANLSRTVFTLTKDEQKGPGYVVLRMEKSKGSALEPTLLKLSAENRWFLICQDKPSAKKPEPLTAQEIADFVGEKGEVKTSSILEHFSERAKTRSIEARIDDAVRAGLINKGKRGIYISIESATSANAQTEEWIEDESNQQVGGDPQSAAPIGSADCGKGKRAKLTYREVYGDR